MTKYASTNTLTYPNIHPRHMQLPHNLSRYVELQAFSANLVEYKRIIYMNIYDVCEHNLEAHFLCNRTGALRQAEWSSHLRKLRMPFFLNSGWNPFGSLLLHTVMYKHTHIDTHTLLPTNKIHLFYGDTHNFKESFPKRFPCIPAPDQHCQLNQS